MLRSFLRITIQPFYLIANRFCPFVGKKSKGISVELVRFGADPG
jgi:hypothetical protein